MSSFDRLLHSSIEELDFESKTFREMEDARQKDKIIMIASESIAPAAVREALSSNFTNIYAEGYPSPRMTKDPRELLMDIEYQMAYYRRYSDRRYYKGCEIADFVESMAQKRVRRLFANERVPYEKLYANVQSLSGAAANNAVYNAFCKPGDTVMGLELAHGGHLTHGSPYNRSGKIYNIVSYKISPNTNRIDYDGILAGVKEHRPKMLIAGFSAYPWSIDWKRLREICDETGTVLLADIAHTAGLIAAGEHPSPVGYAHAISFTTHKTLCGARGAVILTDLAENAEKINVGVFPGEQGGPHINAIYAKAVQFGICLQPEFKELMANVRKNCLALANALQDEGLELAYGGTDSHLCLVDLQSCKCKDGSFVDGEIASRILDLAGIVINKNTKAGDESAAHPSAIRFGTTWVTQIGYGEEQMKAIAKSVARLLKDVVPFCYKDVMGKLGRGKLNVETLAEVACDVDKITGRFRRMPRSESPLLPGYEKRGLKMRKIVDAFLPVHYGHPDKEEAAWKSGCALIDLSANGILEVAGDVDRVRAFMKESATADVGGVTADKAKRTLFLNGQGEILDDAIVSGYAHDDPAREAYLVLSNPESKGLFAAWLQGLSDGYTIFDPEDKYIKVEGPVTIKDMTLEMGWRVMGLFGPKAPDAFAQAFPKADELKSGMQIALEENVVVLRSDVGEQPRIYLYVPGTEFVEIYQKIKKSKGVVETGQDARISADKALGLGLWQKDQREKSMDYAAKPEFASWFDFSKTYFVGRHTLKSFCQDTGDKTEWSFTETEAELLQTPLYDTHIELGKKSYMVPFAGWSMPVRYGSIMEEHEAVRTHCGLFDVGHMGVISITGRYACRFLDTVFSNYASWTEVGQSMYGYLMDAGGVCIDDCLIYRRGIENFMMVCNAANKDKVWDWLNAVNESRVIIDPEYPAKTVDGKATLVDLKDPSAKDEQRVDIALQGPTAMDVVLTIVGDDNPEQVHDILELPRTGFIECNLGGIDLILSKTGYTGEQVCFEFYVHPDKCVALWNMLMETGEAFGIKPCGLAARDSLRTEAGLPLYGHELAGKYEISPGGAGYAGYVKLHKPFFTGRSAFMASEKQRKMKLVRFAIVSEGAARRINPGDRVLDKRGKVVGVTTSCTLTPDGQVGLAYILNKYEKPGTLLGIIPSPRNESGLARKTPSELWVGDNVVLNETAKILPRFMGMDE